jgi:hypothetical protein
MTLSCIFWSITTWLWILSRTRFLAHFFLPVILTGSGLGVPVPDQS